MAMLWKNDASSTIAGALTTTSTTINLQPGTGALFPNPTGGDYFLGTLYDAATKTITEIVKCTARNIDTLTVVRGQEGTPLGTWNAGDLFANIITAGTLAQFTQTGSGPTNTSVVYVGDDTSTTANTIVANTTPVPAGGLALGMLFTIRVKNANTNASGTSVYLQLNGLAGVAIKRTDGSDLIPGNLTAGQEYVFVYNGTNFDSTIPPIPTQPPQTTFYVRPNGNDANVGYPNDDAHAFRSISGAMYTIKQRYISTLGITIRVADGTYADAISDTSNYISSWAIIGDTANPGACVIDATSTVQASYPANASIGRCAAAYGESSINLYGFTFKSYYENVAAAIGSITVTGCNFTAPTSGVATAIACNGGYTGVFGTNTYSGTNGASLCTAWSGGIVNWGYHDFFSTQPVTFNLAAGVNFSVGTMEAIEGATINAYPTVTTFTGTVPACPQFYIASGGGITFQGNPSAGVFPGTQPGVVNPPGWIA
jgi:hypothetical protein